MAEEIVITGVGVACPLGVGVEAVWAAIESGQSGVRIKPELLGTGWPAPYGGEVPDFDPKQHVTPRKSLKVMAREIQLAFAAGELAWQSTGLAESEIDPERMGVVCGAGLLYCEPRELEAGFLACQPDGGGFDYDRWGTDGLRGMYPLWMLKYLPNMSACHVGIRRDARGPTNTIAHGDTSSLLALGEAVGAIQRGDADIMLTGGSSSRLYLTDPYWRSTAELWQAEEDPATMMRPFDARRGGVVCGEGAAILVIESRRHAERRGAKPLARVASVVSRTEPSLLTSKFTGSCIASAIGGALETAGTTADQIGSVVAHGLSLPHEDTCEATAIRQTLGDVPVTALKSYFGNLGAASSVVELAIALQGQRQGIVPATLNYQVPDEACPVNVVTQPVAPKHNSFVSLSYNSTGQAVATVISAE